MINWINILLIIVAGLILIIIIFILIKIIKRKMETTDLKEQVIDTDFQNNFEEEKKIEEKTDSIIEPAKPNFSEIMHFDEKYLDVFQKKEILDISNIQEELPKLKENVESVSQKENEEKSDTENILPHDVLDETLKEEQDQSLYTIAFGGNLNNEDKSEKE